MSIKTTDTIADLLALTAPDTDGEGTTVQPVRISPTAYAFVVHGTEAATLASLISDFVTELHAAAHLVMEDVAAPDAA